MSVTLTANRELPIPAEVWERLGLRPGEEFEVLTEQDRLVAIRKTSPQTSDFRGLMERLNYVRAGQRFTRDEANER
jgi:AbrB family looped-hinge helix DNA binding protein